MRRSLRKVLGWSTLSSELEVAVASSPFQPLGSARIARESVTHVHFIVPHSLPLRSSARTFSTDPALTKPRLDDPHRAFAAEASGAPSQNLLQNMGLPSALNAHMEELKGLGKYALLSLTLTVSTLAIYYDSLLDMTLSILPLQKVHVSSAGIGTSVLLCLAGALFLCWPVLIFQALSFLLPSFLPAERSRALSVATAHLALSILALQLFPAAIGLSAEALDPHMPQLLELDASGGFESVLGKPALAAAEGAADVRLPQIHLDPSLDSMLRQIVKTALGTLLATHIPLILAPYLSTRVHDAAARAGIRKRGLLLAFLLSTPWAGLSLERGALAMGAGVLILEAAILAGYYWRRTRGLLTVLAAR